MRSWRVKGNLRSRSRLRRRNWRIASERIGRETVTYVSNIYKYYVTYLLIQGEYIQRQAIKKAQ
jgi:hypothetical protein